ncbi:hypothetical protein [Agromyces sp. NBRC 114283]|uniref:hypothetical protein n=1 Tax=Agromyces sp. NBRC 114283 TaxID=2994521 RepID=UPI002557B0DA|nr:hypothetical protein [Agromyces sp. NBRC 114283]
MTNDPQWEAYRAAKPVRPGWANALIVAAVLFLAAIVFTLMSGFSTATLIVWLAVVVALVVAGIKALMALGR